MISLVAAVVPLTLWLVLITVLLASRSKMGSLPKNEQATHSVPVGTWEAES